jgi:hypothetical protein
MLIPPDPKNAWLFGFSKSRIEIGAVLLVIIGVFGWLTYKSRRDSRWLGSIEKRTWEFVRNFRWSFPVLWVAYFSLSVGLYLYFVLTSPYIAVLLRLSPLVMFVSLCALQGLGVFYLFSSRQPPEERSSEDTSITVPIKPKKVAFFLIAVVGLLVLASIDVEIIYHLEGSQKFLKYARKFFLDEEANIPSYFSTLLLLFSATLLWIIALLRRRITSAFSKHWFGLSFIYIFLSLDEAAGFHELVTIPLRRYFVNQGIDLPRFLYFAWILPAAVLLLFLAGAYLRFFKHLPSSTKILFLVAASLYLGGAIGIEMIGGQYDALHDISNHDLTYTAIASVEEILEMFGVIVFIYALLEYIRIHFPNQHLRLG